MSSKEYHREYSKKWYQKDTEIKIAKRRRTSEIARQINLKYIRGLKESNSCTDCGKFYPFYVMHFDHLPGSIKVSGLSQMRTWSLEKIKTEIAKCELVCANCHAIRTYIRL